MDSQVQQYFKWKMISLIAFGALIFLWAFVPKFHNILGLKGLYIAAIALMLTLYYFQAKSGYYPSWYYPRWYYPQPLTGTYMSPK
jgi:hypothetical protein